MLLPAMMQHLGPIPLRGLISRLDSLLNLYASILIVFDNFTIFSIYLLLISLGVIVISSIKIFNEYRFLKLIGAASSTMSLFIFLLLGTPNYKLLPSFLIVIITYSIILLRLVNPIKQLYIVFIIIMIAIPTYLLGLLKIYYNYIIIIDLFFIIGGFSYLIKYSKKQRGDDEQLSSTVTLSVYLASLISTLNLAKESQLYFELFWIFTSILIILTLQIFNIVKRPELIAGLAGLTGVITFIATDSTINAILVVTITASCLVSYQLWRSNIGAQNGLVLKALILLLLGISIVAVSSIQLYDSSSGRVAGMVIDREFSSQGIEASVEIPVNAKTVIDELSLLSNNINSSSKLYLLILQMHTVGNIQAPGIIQSVTVYDLETKTNITRNGSETSIILFNVDKPVDIRYAIKPGEDNNELLVSIELTGVLIPWNLIGNESISPIHNVLIVKFRDPLIVQASNNYTIVIKEAVLASKRFLGGKGSINETGIGIYIDNAILGIRHGAIEFPDGIALNIPKNVSEDNYRAWKYRINMTQSNPELDKILSAIPSIVSSDLTSLATASHVTIRFPEYLESRISITSIKNQTTTCAIVYYHKQFIDTCSPIIEPMGIMGLRIINLSDPVIEYNSIKADYIKASIVKYVLSHEAPYYALITASIVSNDTGNVLWIASNMNAFEQRVELTRTTIEAPFYNLGGLAPFLFVSSMIIGTYMVPRKQGG